MKILFVMRHTGYVRNFESTLRRLCDRGHKVHLALQIAGTHWLLDASDVATQLSQAYPHFTRGSIPVREDAWGHVARELRLTLDYLRYLGPEYRNAPKLRERAMRDVSDAMLARTQAGPFSGPRGRALLSGVLRGLLRAVPTDARIDAFLTANRPDVLVVTPLIEPGAPQAEYVRSARALGIPTALSVASWDNLTNKGLIHGPVDLVAVWNEMMKAEAVTMHGVPPERVIVTGAQPFDHWFDWRPSTTRDEFCARVGLPADRPYVLYLCSSKFIAPVEVPSVRAWALALRGSASPLLRQAGILVRPHPQNADQWKDADLSDLGPIAVWPRGGAAPSDDAKRAEYFDSIFHSGAVVGVNTTAEIESAIIGRSVFTLLTPEFRDTQEGTLHFEHLRSANGGLLHVAASLDEHLAQIEPVLASPGRDDERCRRFVEAFVRPYGVKTPATARLVDALEGLAQAPVAPADPAPWWARLARPALWRHGEWLQRGVLLEQETKAARARRKKLPPRHEPAHAAVAAPAATREHAGATSAAGAAAAPAKKGLRTWREVADAFSGLGYEDRVRFGQATFDSLPGELLLEHARPERLDYDAAEIRLRVISKRERERLKSCAKEPFTVQWLHEWVGAGEVFYDIGANIGAYSLVAAKKPGGAARVFAFEPGYANMSSLCANIVLNDAADAVTPLPFALSDRNDLTVFGLRALEPGAARHTLGGGPSEEGPSLYQQPVVTWRLDDLVDHLRLPLPQHIKLDVDGGELAVLDGAARVLAAPGLRSLLVEVSTALSEDVAAVLDRHGLQLTGKVDVENKHGQRLVWYGLFTRAGERGRPLQVQHVAR